MSNGRIDEIVFPLLSLSPEVRNIIYSFALTSFSLRTYCTNAEKRWTRLGLVADWPKERCKPYLNLLLANHQIYHETSHILYHRGRFLIPVFVFNTLDEILSKPPGITSPSRPVKNFSELAATGPNKHLIRIQNIEVEVNWFRSVRGTLPQRSFAGRLDSIFRGLSVFPHLKTVTVSWQSYSVDSVRLKGVELFDILGTPRTLQLFESFVKFQAEHPDIVVMVAPPSIWAAVTRNTRHRAWIEPLKGFIEVMGTGKWIL